MVEIELYSGSGKSIPYEIVCRTYRSGDELFKLLLETFPDFSNKEWMTLLHLLAKAIAYGGEVEEIRNYIELFDKIKKIVNQNDCK